MKDILLSDGEWKLMNLLWEESPMTVRELTLALKDDTGWSKATVNMMLMRLAEKGAVEIDSSGAAKLCRPLLAREEAVRSEARSTLGRIKTSGLNLLVCTMTRDSGLTDEEVDELYKLLKEASKHD